jgi:hypothetical protein
MSIDNHHLREEEKNKVGTLAFPTSCPLMTISFYDFFLTFNVLDLGDQVAPGQLAQNLVGSSVAQFGDLGDNGRWDDLVVLGAHLSLFI